MIVEKSVLFVVLEDRVEQTGLMVLLTRILVVLNLVEAPLAVEK